MISKKIVLIITGVFLFSLVVGATESQPDSVYFDSNRILMLTYTIDSVRVLEASFDRRNQLVLEERTANWSDSIYMERPLYSYGELKLNADCENELTGKKIPVPYKYGHHDYTFFAPGRYAIVRWEKNQYGNTDEYQTEHYTVSNAWRQESIGELNFGVMYDLYTFFREKDYAKQRDWIYNPEEYDYGVEGLMIPLADGRFLNTAGSKENVADLLSEHDYDPKEMLYSRQLMYDTDTVCINGKYGLYTLTGEEIIPAVYDSLLPGEVLVCGIRNSRFDLLDYMGGTVARDLRLVLPVFYRYQVLEDDGTMYFLDKNGEKQATYSHSYMSVDDILYPLGLDIVLLPPGKSTYYPKKYQKNYKTYTWVNFIYPGDYQEYERMKFIHHPLGIPTEEQWKKLGFEKLYGPYLYGPYELLTFLDIRDDYDWLIDHYGIDRIKWRRYYDYDQRDAMFGYRIEAYHLPKQYKNPTLVTGTYEYYRTGDYETLPPSWIIALQKGKYGVFNVTAPEEPVLPFIYDQIDGNNTHLILYKDGLCAYYPLSETPRYKELQPFVWKLARFCLPDGRYGWLSKDGTEFIDNE